MAVENIQSREQSATLTPIRLMLSFLRVPQEIGFGAKGLLALDAVI
jgi:hypothetical protein